MTITSGDIDNPYVTLEALREQITRQMEARISSIYSVSASTASADTLNMQSEELEDLVQATPSPLYKALQKGKWYKPRALKKELAQIEKLPEVKQVCLVNDTFYILTNNIKSGKTPLGQFLIRISKGEEIAINISCGGGINSHQAPNVQNNGGICLGNGADEGERYKNQGEVSLFLNIVFVSLTNKPGRNAYRSLSEWKIEVHCKDAEQRQKLFLNQVKESCQGIIKKYPELKPFFLWGEAEKFRKLSGY